MPTFLEDIETTSPAQAAPRVQWLDNAQYMSLVRFGALDIFLQRRQDDGTGTGARHHLFRAEAGTLVQGIDPVRMPEGWGLLAVKLPDSTTSHIPQELLQYSLLQHDTLQEAQTLLHAWVKLTSASVLAHMPPKHYTALHQDSVNVLADDEAASPELDVGWIRVQEGEVLWMGEDSSLISAHSGACPIPSAGFLRSKGQSSLQTVTLQTLVEDHQLANALQQHLSLIVRHALRTLEHEEQTQTQRLTGLSASAKQQTSEALAMLVGVSKADKPASTPAKSKSSGEDRTTQLMQALELIGKRVGIEFKSPPPRASENMLRNPVNEVCAASDVRFREVAFKQTWWTDDCGPMLAMYGEDLEWVALLPVNDTRYEMYNPATGESTPVTPEVANQLASYGFSFYRSLPSRKLSGLDIIRYSLFGRMRDVRRILTISMLTGLLAMMVPVSSGLLIDTFIPMADVNSIWMLVVALFVVAVSTSMLGVAQSIAMLRFENIADNALQSAVIDRVLKLPMPFFREFSMGDLSMRMNSINSISRALTGSTLDTILDGIFSFFNFALLFVYSPKLAGVATILVVISLAVTVTIGFIKLRYERHLAEAQGKLSSLVFQYLNGITKIRIAAAESRAFANWAQRYAAVRKISFQSQHLGNIGQTFSIGYTQLITAAIFAAFGLLLTKEESSGMSAGNYIAFSAAFGAFFGGLSGLVSTVMRLLNLVPIYERAKPLLETEPEPTNNLPDPGELQGEIEIANLSFEYNPGAPILKDVSFRIKPGEYVALVGPSGSGKSTLLRLMLGFEKPSSGTISYDGQDMASVDIGALRRQLGVVLQSGKLMTGDIFSNIVGMSNLSIDDAWEAARMVGLDDDIDQMAMGMHTVISDGASTFSGGQRQRIMIARAIVHRPRILYFDEATSALDNRTQAIVTQSLDRMKSTRIVIAHRLSTIVNADRVIVLEAGRIVQDGTYAELLAQPGLFQDLARRQIA